MVTAFPAIRAALAERRNIMETVEEKTRRKKWQ
jgi:hypothetical protein